MIKLRKFGCTLVRTSVVLQPGKTYADLPGIFFLELSIATRPIYTNQKWPFTAGAMEAILTPETKIKKQPTESCSSTFADPTLDRMEMTTQNKLSLSLRYYM